MPYKISTQVLQLKSHGWPTSQVQTLQGLTLDIQITRLPNIFLENVVFVLTKANSQDEFTNVKTVM
jgi:hypothetical protein